MKSDIHLELLVNDIITIHTQARLQVARLVNDSLTQANWEVGKRIVEDEQGGKATAEYGKKTLNLLSKELTQQLGRGYSKSNLFNMRNFYLKYPIFQMLSGKLKYFPNISTIFLKKKGLY